MIEKYTIDGVKNGIGIEDECVKIFDPIKKELIKVCNNYPDTARYLGLPKKTVRDAIRFKTRRYSPLLKKEVALRIGNKNKINEKTTNSSSSL